LEGDGTQLDLTQPLSREARSEAGGNFTFNAHVTISDLDAERGAIVGSGMEAAP
jgi:hypothetical protein